MVKVFGTHYPFPLGTLMYFLYCCHRLALRTPKYSYSSGVLGYQLVLFINRAPKRSHTLRYVLKNRATDTVLFVVLFTLYLKEDVDEDGNVKDGVEGGKPFDLRR